MGLLARYWQQAVLKTKCYVSSPRARSLERELVAARNEKQAMLTEISSVEAELDSIRSKDEGQLKELEQRLGHIESEREAAHRQLHTLQHSLTEAVTKLERTETQLGQLDAKLEKERRKYQGEMQEAQERAHRQERRLNWALMVAGIAFLLGTVASVTKILDTRNNTQVLGELSRDIKDIKASMEQQLGSMRDSLEEYRVPLFDETAGGQSPNSNPALAGTPQEQPDQQPVKFATAPSIFRYHPQNKYRTRAEMEAFFEENARELGVISLDSGLQYKVLSHGIGRSPNPGDRVVFDYRALLPDGREIYNSYDTAEPAVFGIEQVMPGLREALLRMEEGAQWELYVPPELAYRGGTRKRKKYGYEPLIYIVELRSVVEGGQSIEN